MKSEMHQTAPERPAGQLTSRAPARGDQRQQTQPNEQRGFGGRAKPAGKRRANKKRSPGLSKADWGPLGKHPDVNAIVARQRLHLPLSGRLGVLEVNQAWKRCAAEHHPDRGGEHNTMQLVNGARDLLLGRDQRELS
jgi:hypothetical protein